MVHNQNNLRSIYNYNNKLIVLYDITLTPDYFKVFMYGQYLDQAFIQLPYLTQCKSLIEKNANYGNAIIKAVEIYNSSLSTDPMKVMIYS